MSLPSRVSLVRDLPPQEEPQSRAGTCTAHAVVTLLEYLTDCRTRLSTAFLFAAMRIKVSEWLERNISATVRGERGDADFEHVFQANLAGLRCVLAENAPDTMAAQRFVEMFRAQASETFAQSRGCPIRFASEALQEFGICRHTFWPEGKEPATEPFASSAPTLPPEAEADARRRRFANGLDFLPEPGNVEAIKSMLAGVNGNRRMPVVLALGPDAEHDAHAVLAIGYRTDASQPGGGFFLIRDGSGSRTTAKLPYADVAKRCTEAATIIQSMADYAGDGYGGSKTRRRLRLAACAAMLTVLMAAGAFGWNAWRSSPSVLDAPFERLAHPDAYVERISIVGDRTYGTCLRDAEDIKSQFFQRKEWDRVDASFCSNGLAAATSSAPDILLLFARAPTQTYSKADKEAIARYLSSGGTVLAFVCDCNRPLMADFLSTYGVNIQGLPGKPPIKAIAPMVRNGQLDGYSLFRVTEMTDDWHAMIVTDDDSKAPVMAFRRVENGKLFCVAQQLTGPVGDSRFRNIDWWGDFLFACASDSYLCRTEAK